MSRKKSSIQDEAQTTNAHVITDPNLKPIAQEHAWRTLLSLSEALPQGLILVGPSGVGKKRAVKALYQWLHCQTRLGSGAASEQDDSTMSLLGGSSEPAQSSPAQDMDEPCGHCVSCRKIAENKHTDLIEISPKGETIAVDDLREMKKTLFFPPMEGKFRFVIIDEAHKLNVFSANNILKTLEEPPAHTRFFLITHERSLLLPTIISRCQFVHFSPLDPDSMKTLLAKMNYEIPARLMPVCLDLLSGGIDRAGQLADEKTLEFIDAIQREIDSGVRRWEQMTALAEQFGSEEWKLELFLDLLVRAGHRGALSSRDLEQVMNHSHFALDAAFLRRRLDRFANKKLIGLAAAELSARKPQGQVR